MGILSSAVAVIARAVGLTDPRLYQFFSGAPTHAGETVTVNTSLSLDTVWACVRLKSQTLATLPLLTYSRDKTGRGVVDRQHPIYRLLHDRPNADMTATEFWEAMAAALLLWGNAYAAISRTGLRVVSITPMRPDLVTVQRRSDGSLLYRYSFQGTIIELPEDEVFHIKGFSLDGMVGISPVSQGRESIGAALAAEKASAAFFKNGMRPSAVLSAPTYLTDTQRQRKAEWLTEFTGALNTGKIPLVEGGWKMEHMSLPPEDAQLLATRGFHVEQLCRWFDVPPVMIGHTQSATAWGTGMEHMMLWFLTFSLRPMLKRIEQAISKSLILPAEQNDVYAEFNVEGLLRADSKGRSELYAVYADHGLMTRNEMRALDNMPPVIGGDLLTVSSSLLPLELLGEFVRGRTDKPLDPGFKQPGPSNPGGAQASIGDNPNSSGDPTGISAAASGGT